MQISRDFTIAVHVLLCIEYFGKTQKVTSDFIARSVGVNPVIIRRMFIKLKDSGIIEVNAGTGGARLIRNKKDLTLFEIYSAAGCREHELFNFHENPNKNCPVGSKIHKILDEHINEATLAMENKLKTIKFSTLIKDLES